MLTMLLMLLSRCHAITFAMLNVAATRGAADAVVAPPRHRRYAQRDALRATRYHAVIAYAMLLYA